jgi:hypothetical protein
MCDRYVIKQGGANPLQALTGGIVSQSKGVYREVESEESDLAKRWPDEQKPQIRLLYWTRGHSDSKSNTCTESILVDAAGISGNVL